MADKYLGLRRGDTVAVGNVQAGSSSAGSAVDVEVRWSDSNNLTKLDLVCLLMLIIHFTEGNGANAAGANLPAN